MPTSLKLVKQPDFIAEPTNLDITSGMQLAASGSALGIAETVDGTFSPGQDLGDAEGALYLRATE